MSRGKLFNIRRRLPLTLKSSAPSSFPPQAKAPTTLCTQGQSCITIYLASSVEGWR